MWCLVRVTRRGITSFLKAQPHDYFLDHYVRSLDFQGVQAERLHHNLVLFGVGQSVYQDQESKMRSMADLVLESDQHSCSLFQVSPDLYQRQGGHGQEVDVHVLGQKVHDYYRIPLFDEKQLTNQEPTINTIIQAVETKLFDPTQSLYYNYHPLLVLCLLKKNRIILADMPRALLFQTILSQHSPQDISDLFSLVTHRLHLHGLSQSLSLHQAVLVFQPQFFAYLQLHHLVLQIDKALHDSPSGLSVFLNQEYFTILKEYYASSPPSLHDHPLPSSQSPSLDQHGLLLLQQLFPPQE